MEAPESCSRSWRSPLSVSCASRCSSRSTTQVPCKGPRHSLHLPATEGYIASRIVSSSRSAAAAIAMPHSIRINIQYRVCFVWEDGDAYDVEILDYHR
jgi:hypothetical protein